MCSILSLHLGASSNPPREVKKLTQSQAASDSQILSYTAGLLFPCLFLLAMALTGPLLIMYRNVYGGGSDNKTNKRSMGRKDEKARNNLPTEQSSVTAEWKFPSPLWKFKLKKKKSIYFYLLSARLLQVSNFTLDF